MTTIIGAGISGLTLAYFLQKKNVPYQLLEASDQVGGYLQTKQSGDYLLELGANSLLADAEIQDFMVEIGLKDDILMPEQVSQNRFIYRNGKYRVLPSKPQQLLWNTFFSWHTKYKIWAETRKKAEKNQEIIQNETLSHFFARRFSQEIVDYALNPFIAGVYAGNPDELLVKKTFPILADYEQQYGSVIKGLVKNKGNARRVSFSFKKGMQQFPQKIASHLQNMVFGCKVLDIAANENSEKKYLLKTSKGDFFTDKIIFTTSAFHTADMLKNLDTDFSKKLQTIDYPPIAVVHTAFLKKDISHKLNGFGGLNPQKEQLFSLGSIWTGSIFPDRCPKNEVLFTTFVGGSRNPNFVLDNLQKPENIAQNITQELQKLYKISANPTFQECFIWKNAIPQMNKKVLFLDDIILNDQNNTQNNNYIEAFAKENIFFCVNWIDGVSVADCWRKAKKWVEQFA